MLNAVRNPEGITTLGLASSRFARRYFGNLGWFLFLRLLRCFSSAGLPPYDYLIHHTVLEYCSSGFPHSEIHGSMDICSSPWLIAACHVLLRLLMPRHSSYALISLTLYKSVCFCFLRHSNFQTISRSPWVSTFFIMWVSLVKFFRYHCVQNTFSYPFLFEKTFIFSYFFSNIQFSNNSS